MLIPLTHSILKVLYRTKEKTPYQALIRTGAAIAQLRKEILMKVPHEFSWLMVGG